MSPTKPAATCDLEFTGTLLEKATARTKFIDTEGHNGPVLCMVLQLEAPTRPIAQVEQSFPLGAMAQCEAEARRYRAGMRVTIRANVLGVRLLVPNVSHIHVEQEEAAAA